MQNKTLVMYSLIVAIILFVLAAIFFNTKKDTALNSVDKKELLLREYSIKDGFNGKNISIVQFIDPECGPCAIFHKAVKKLYKEYYKDIQIVTKYIANHKNSEFTIKLAEAAREQNLYNEVLEIILDTQHLWAKPNFEKPELLWDLLSNIKELDIEKLKVDMNNPKIDQIIKQDRSDAITLEVRGTPTLFIDGELLKTLSTQELFNMVEDKLIK